MKRVLMLCYFFPPRGGVVVERPLLFTRLLPEFGWQPVVLTPHERAVVAIRAGEGMELPAGLEVVRTPPNPDLAMRAKRALGMEMSKVAEEQLGGTVTRWEAQRDWRWRLFRFYRNWVEIPDHTIDWYPFMLWRARRLLAEGCFDAVYSQSPPYTTAIAASRLAAKTGAPFVADLADLWTRQFNYAHTGLPLRLDRWLEKRALARASAVITLDRHFSDMMREAYPGLSGRLEVVQHGFDSDVLDRMEPRREPYCNLLYAGSLYHPPQDIGPLFRAMAALRDEGADLSRFRLQYVGRNDDLVVQLAEAAGVAGLVDARGQVPYAEALARLKGAQALLYIQWEPGGEVTVNTKLVQYLGARRPVLAYAPTAGEADRVLAETRGGVVAHNEGELIAVLRGWLADYTANGAIPYDGDEQRVDDYSYRGRAGQLAAILDRVSGRQ